MIYLDLIINVILNIIDVILITFLCYKFITVSDFKNFWDHKKKIVFLIWGLVLGILATFVEAQFYKLIFQLSIIGIIMIISRIHELNKIFTLYILINSVTITMQFLIAIIFSLISLKNVYIQALLGQTLTLLTIILISMKVNLWGIYIKIQDDFIIKLLFSLAVVVICTGLIFFEFNYLSRRYLNLVLYICIECIFISIFIIAISKITYYTKKLPKKYHEYKTILSNIYIAYHTKEGKEFNKILEYYLDILDVPFEPLSERPKEHPILIFINHKLSFKNLKSEINFSYQDPNRKVTDDTIITILGILLDNAIRETVDKKIIINIMIDELQCYIEIGNQIVSRLDIKKIYDQNGYSSKKEAGHGYGLTNLKEIVTYIQGTIKITTKICDCTTYVFFKIEA